MKIEKDNKGNVIFDWKEDTVFTEEICYILDHMNEEYLEYCFEKDYTFYPEHLEDEFEIYEQILGEMIENGQ